MHRYRFSIVLFLLAAGRLAGHAADVPDWYLHAPQNDQILVGRGFAEVVKSKAVALAEAKRDALRDLAQSVACRLTSQTIDHQSEQEGASAGLDSRFTSRVSVASELQLANPRVMHEQVGRGGAYVVVSIKRDELRAGYKSSIVKLLTAAQRDFVAAAESEDQGRAVDALRCYERCVASLGEAETAIGTYRALTRWTQPVPAVSGVPAMSDVEKRLQLLAARTPRSVSQIAEALAATIGAAGVKGSWYVCPFEFGQTQFVSEFGHTLTTVLGAALVSRTGGRLVDPSAAAVRVRGRLIPSGDGVLIVANVEGAQSAATQHFVEAVTCEAIGWNRIKPRDLDRLLQEKLALHKALSASTGLKVELRTDRSDNGPVVYRYGDQPKLAVRANRECYVRLIDVSSDGTKLLLLDRYHIDESQANRWVKLPLELEVCEPPGVEQLILQAATSEAHGKMPALKIREVDAGDGFVLPIIVESLDAAMARTRGVMVRKRALFAEVPYQWTVFER